MVNTKKKLLLGLSSLLLAVTMVVVSQPEVSAFDSNANPVRINRMTIAMGDPTKAENLFYDKDSSDDTDNWKNITAGCSSEFDRDLQLTLSYTTKLPDGSCSPKKTKTFTALTDVKDWSERDEVVFFRDNTDVVHSVKADLDLSFINSKLSARGNAQAIYVQKGVEPYSCPSLIVDQKQPDGWAYVMMEKASDAGDASDEYDSLMQDLGKAGFFPGVDMSQFDDICKAAGDDDDEGNLKRIGLPESYYNAGSSNGWHNGHKEDVDFGYPGHELGAVELHSMFGMDAAGMSLNGPLKGGFIAASELEEGNPDGDMSEPVCSAGKMGWVLCPLSEFMQDATSTVADKLQTYLVFSPLLGSPQGKAIEAVWRPLLNVANVLLVIAFFFVIFSQATSVGISNYGVKKLLPKIIAAAILMNLSFFLCAIAVDISNIVGASIKNIVNFGIEALPAPGPGMQEGADGADYAISGLIGGIALVGLAAAGLLPLFFPIIAIALVAVLTAFAVVVVRQVLITLLIIVSPLAFAAWILPNTESLFTKWRKSFTVLLMMFPIIMGIFYGSVLVARIILTASPETGQGAGFMTQIIALAVLTIPLFSLPFILKAAGGVLDRFGVITNNKGKGLIDRSRKKGQAMSANSGYQRYRASQKQARDSTGQRRYLEGKGLGGRIGTGSRRVGSATAFTPAGRESSRMLNEQLNEARDKITEGRIANASKYMSLEVAKGVAGGQSVQKMLEQSAAGTNYTAAEDKSALEYLKRSGLDGAKNNRVLASSSLSTLFQAEDIPFDGTSHEAAVNTLAGMIDPNDAHENAQFSKTVRDGALKAGYKDLAYGEVTGGKFKKVVPGSKDPAGIVASGLAGINKESLNDVDIRAAIAAKAAKGTSERLQLIQQTMHINKDKSIDQLAIDLKITPALLREARQSIASNGTVPMPPGL